jgi:hypothetical protein
MVQRASGSSLHPQYWRKQAQDNPAWAMRWALREIASAQVALDDQPVATAHAALEDAALCLCTGSGGLIGAIGALELAVTAMQLLDAESSAVAHAQAALGWLTPLASMPAARREISRSGMCSGRARSGIHQPVRSGWADLRPESEPEEQARKR